MSQEQGSQISLRFSSVNHPKCSMSSFLARQPVIQALQVIHPQAREADATEARANMPKCPRHEVVRSCPRKVAAEDLLHSSVPIQYKAQCTLSAFLEAGFLEVACDVPERSVAGHSLRGPDQQDMKSTLHPSGWMALDMDSNTYHRFGLTGHRFSGPKSLKNSSLQRRSQRHDRYVVLVKLKRLRTRVRYFERVKQAFRRIDAIFQWIIAFFDKGIPVVRSLILQQEVDLPAAFSSVGLQSAHSQHVCLESASILDLPALFLHNDSTTMSAQDWSPTDPSTCTLPTKRKNTDHADTQDGATQTQEAYVSDTLQCSQALCEGCEPNVRFTKQPLPDVATQSVVCEYLGMLACGISPVAAMFTDVGASSVGEVHVSSWRGIMGGATVTHAVRGCMDMVLTGKWPWACVLLHAFKNSPFAWKGELCEDGEVQNLARPGCRNREWGADAGEAIGALLLLPRNHVCLLAMSGIGDNFCRF